MNSAKNNINYGSGKYQVQISSKKIRKQRKHKVIKSADTISKLMGKVKSYLTLQSQIKIVGKKRNVTKYAQIRM